MLNRLKKALPALAVGAALTSAVGLVALSNQWQSAVVDTSVARLAVDATLTTLQALHPDSLEDPTFQRAVEQAAQARYVASVWLFTPDGRIVQSRGCLADSTAAYHTVQEAATDDTRRVIEALPDGTLSETQQTWLLAASAIRREGDHNDVFRHMIRPIQKPDGSVAALIGLAYDLSAVPVGLGWKLSLLAAFLGLAVYWLSLPLWVLLDARNRGERAWIWAMFVFIGNLVALLAYVLTRAPAPVTASSR